MASYLRNAWYVACWEQELAGSALLARTLLDVPRVLYRKADGGYAMLLDRCPHRFAPLSLGTRRGDALVCAYHGLEFGADGRCTHSPFSATPPAQAAVESLPVLARHGLVWFWPGERARADPALVPDFAFLDGQDVWRRYSHFKGNYELLVDNLMDLSHVDFLHRKTFNTAGTHPEALHEVHDGAGNTLWNNWLIPRVRKFPVLVHCFAADEAADQFTEMRWDAPASMMLRLSWRPAGGDAATTRHTMVSPHIITPETGTSSHYFWTCEPNADAEAFARVVFDEEDAPMIRAVQQRMGEAEFWSLQPLILKGDVGAVRARRRLRRLQQLERGETAAADA